MKSLFTIVLILCSTFSFSLNITLNPASAPCGTTTISGNTGCNHNGTLQVAVAGNPSGISITDITAIAAGNFSFKVTVSPAAPVAAMLNFTIITSDDPTGCALPSATASANMNFQCACNLVVSVIPSGENCFGCGNGTATATVVGATDPVSFNWTSGASGNQAANLAPGNYSVTATDANGCTHSTTFNISAYVCTPIIVQGVIVHTTCHDDCDGSIQLGPLSNGSTAFSATWNEGQSTSFLSDLCAATYAVTVSDTDNCTATATFTVTQPSPIIIALDTVVHATAASGGLIRFSISGVETNALCEMCHPILGICGVCGEFTSNSAVLNNLEPGCYMLRLSNPNGCVAEFDTICIQDLASSAKDLFSLQHIHIYPNPANDFIIVEVQDNITIESVLLRSTDGIEVYRNNIDVSKIDISPLTPGMYFLSISDGRSVVTKPVVILR